MESKCSLQALDFNKNVIRTLLKTGTFRSHPPLNGLKIASIKAREAINLSQMAVYPLCMVLAEVLPHDRDSTTT